MAELTPIAQARQSPEPIRIRTRMDGEMTEVHILMPHPMETGMRTDDAGRLLAAHYITDVQVSVEARTVFAARMSYAVAQDPLIFFRCKGVRAGERLRVAWTDNLGQGRADEILI